MKKNFLLLLFLLGSLGWAYAQHDNLTNVSADFMRAGGRTAALDAADIVVYNPAGLVRLDDGFHINLGNQSFFRSPSHTFTIPGQSTEKSYKQDSPDLLLPNIYLAYKQNKLAIFGGFYISGGGGSLDYPNGSINSDLIIAQMGAQGYYQFYGGATSSILGSSFYMTPLLGVSYSITDKLSAAVSGKYILATNKQEAHVNWTDPVVSPAPLPPDFTLESTDKANGFGFTVGLDYQFSENFNLAARYESKANLEFKTDSIQDSFGALLGMPQIMDGALNRRDLPAVLAVGAGFNLTENFSALLDFGWYFQKQADWGLSPKGEEWSTVAGDVGHLAVGLGYDIADLLQLNGWWGYTMYQYGDKPQYYSKLGVFETVKDNNWSLGLGGQLKLGDRFNINLAFVQTFWKKDVAVPVNLPPLPTFDVITNNSISSFALGVNLRLGGD